MDLGKAFEVADWLNKLPGIHNAAPVKLTIAGRKPQVFFGARYEVEHRYMPTERHVTDGGKTPGDLYTEKRYYLLGSLPKTKKKGSAYREELANIGLTDKKLISDFDWYVAGYWQHEGKNEHHPFGRFWSLHKWDHELPWMGRIDRYERSVYDRYTYNVETL